MNPIRRLNGYFVTYDLPSAFPDPELERPTHLASNEAEDVGWVIDWLDGATKPSKAYPEGRRRWLSLPERPINLETAVVEAQRRRSLDEGGTYRIRNVYTGEVVWCDILTVN